MQSGCAVSVRELQLADSLHVNLLNLVALFLVGFK